MAEEKKGKAREIIGLVILIVVVSVGVFSYMDYQEKKQEQEAYEAWIQELEAKEQAWKEEVAYYENLTYTHPNNYVINEPYEFGRWDNYIEWYSPKILGGIPVSPTGQIVEIRNVTSTELRTEIDHWGNGGINIDRNEGVIFIRRVYDKHMDEEPFEGTILVCWRP